MLSVDRIVGDQNARTCSKCNLGDDQKRSSNEQCVMSSTHRKDHEEHVLDNPASRGGSDAENRAPKAPVMALREIWGHALAAAACLHQGHSPVNPQQQNILFR